MHLVEDQEAEPVAELPSPDVRRFVGAYGYRLDRILASAVYPDVDGEFLLHPLPPLFQQVQRGDDNDGRPIDEFNGLHGNHGLTCARWQHYDASPPCLVPCAKSSLLVPPHSYGPAFHHVWMRREVLDDVLNCRE